MRAFAEAWPEEPIVQAVLAQITWYHNLAILEKLDTPEDRRVTREKHGGIPDLAGIHQSPKRIALPH